MPGFGVELVKGTFFDKKAVADQLDKATKRVLSRHGAFVRRRSKSSLKYGKGTAVAGAPPVVHRGGMTRTKVSKKTGKAAAQGLSPLRELIFFGYDAAKKSVVTGPALGGPASGAPAALEFGDHPFMGPAQAAEMPKTLAGFKDLIR